MKANGERRDIKFACAGKISYSSSSAAAKCMRAMDKTNRKRPMQIYRCPACNGWHLAHKRSKMRMSQ